MSSFALLAAALLALGACCPAARAQERVLLEEGFEDAAAPRVQFHGANQPYEQHALEITTEKAHSGTHSLKVDYTYLHGLQIYLAPRSNETPQVEWGSLGGAGTFNLKGLDIPLRPDRGYVLTVYLWVEQASAQNPVQIEVETATDCDYGVIRTQTYLDQSLAAPSGGWVKVEQELTSLLLDQMDAAGAKTDNLRLNALSLNSFANHRERMTVYVDDLTLRETPFAAVEEARRAQGRLAGNPPAFRSYPEIEDTFVWGAYGGLTEPGPDWFKPYDTKPGADVRAQQAQRVRDNADWMLLDMRRHYCNTLIQGGGMLFASEGQSAFDYVKTCLDKCAEYGMKFSPSTYLTRHYIGDLTVEQCEAAMRKAAAMYGKHPALLAYWLVDEPGAATAEDYYWGKAYLEEQDPAHPALCTCNSVGSIRALAAALPIVCIDYYPLGPVPNADKGCWAVGDSVRYARKLGAKRIWVLPQVFGQSSWRGPSREEFLVQVFASLAEGATGFAPYAHADRPQWHDPRNEYGHLVDPYGNPSPAWEEMQRLGPSLRSAGALLAGAERLPEEAVTARVGAEIISPVGRKRPVIAARAFSDAKRSVRYVVAHSNALSYRWSCPVALRELAPGEQVLDLFALREAPLTGNTFPVFLMPGDGRMFAVGQPAALKAVRDEVHGTRLAIERDLLELEARVARRMGTDTGPVAAALATAQSLEGLATARALLERQSRANARFWPVHTDLERARAALGRANRVMNAQVRDGGAFPPAAPEVKAMTDRMVSLSDGFYTLQARLLREGPKGLGQPMGELRRDAEGLAGEAGALFGG